ncbi:MAG: hypothetical protein NT051_06340 [Candidatus Micrarchaeota archaeon]|nr:hypothetical protein [Candidatus Micrarchaeota archaeon]
MAITQEITTAKVVTRKDAVQLKREYGQFVKAHNKSLNETLNKMVNWNKNSMLDRDGVKVDDKIWSLAIRVNDVYNICNESRITLHEYRERLLFVNGMFCNAWRESPDFPIQKNTPKTLVERSRLFWDTAEKILPPWKIGERKDALAARIEEGIVGRLKAIREAIDSRPKMLYIKDCVPPNEKGPAGFQMVELDRNDAAIIVDIDRRINNALKTRKEMKSKGNTDEWKKFNSTNNAYIDALTDEKTEILATRGKYRFYSGTAELESAKGRLLSYGWAERLGLELKG